MKIGIASDTSERQGGCSDASLKGGVSMDYIQAIFAVAILALLIQLINSIKK
jgi:hypothetical protein